ncbi:MAG: hypothetical protein MR598_01885 [Erysipelotrichaceae bacterium]|nr:hypothetical protein [Erysipelotrichaceae bacterium]
MVRDILKVNKKPASKLYEISKDKYCILVLNYGFPEDKLEYSDLNSSEIMDDYSEVGDTPIITEPYLFEVNSVYNSIYNLGKQLYDLNYYSELNDINRLLPSKKICELITKWININGFPYTRGYLESEFDLPNDEPYIKDFIYDAIMNYVFTSIKILLDEFLDNSSEEPIANADIKKAETKSLLQFVNFKQILDIMEQEVYYPADFYTYDELLNNSNKLSIDSANFYTYDKLLNNINKLSIDSADFINSVQKLMLPITAKTCILRDYDFRIYTIKPVYIDTISDYYSIESSQTIMGISMLRLQQILAAEERGYLTRCHNPQCRMIFNSSKGKLYCSREECQKYRNNIKSKRSYHKK